MLQGIEKKFFFVYFIKHNIRIKGLQIRYRSDGVSFGVHAHMIWKLLLPLHHLGGYRSRKFVKHVGACLSAESRCVTSRRTLVFIFTADRTLNLKVGGLFLTRLFCQLLYQFCLTMTTLKTYSSIHPTRCNFTHFIYIWKLFYMFRVLLPPIIRSANNCIYSICYLSDRSGR
jgi:hypothetical protein